MSPYPKIRMVPKRPQKIMHPKNGVFSKHAKNGVSKKSPKMTCFWTGPDRPVRRWAKVRKSYQAVCYSVSAQKEQIFWRLVRTRRKPWKNDLRNHEKHQNPHLKTNDILDTNRMWVFDVANTRLLIISCHEVIMRCVRWRAPPNTPNGCVGLWPIKTATGCTNQPDNSNRAYVGVQILPDG